MNETERTNIVRNVISCLRRLSQRCINVPEEVIADEHLWCNLKGSADDLESTLPPEGEIDETLDAKLAELVDTADDAAKTPPDKPMTADEKLRAARQRVLDAYAALAPLAWIDATAPITCQRRTALVVHACDALLRASEFLMHATKD